MSRVLEFSQLCHVLVILLILVNAMLLLERQKNLSPLKGDAYNREGNDPKSRSIITDCSLNWNQGVTTNISVSGQWRNIADYRWPERAQQISEYISEDQVVLDMGAGKGALFDFLPSGCRWIPVDLNADIVPFECIGCDFNRREFPFLSGIDVVILQGIFEYIADKALFISLLAQLKPRMIILTYHFGHQVNEMWISPLSERQLVELLADNGLQIRNKTLVKNQDSQYLVVIENI
jgi:hypothetical protein